MLGDDYKTAKVGSVPTPVGTININLAYRTKLLITPQKTMKEVPFEVKDDHFKKDNSPKRPTTPKPCSLGYKRK
jgi:autophagy-related protein 13